MSRRSQKSRSQRSPSSLCLEELARITARPLRELGLVTVRRMLARPPNRSRLRHPWELALIMGDLPLPQNRSRLLHPRRSPSLPQLLPRSLRLMESWHSNRAGSSARWRRLNQAGKRSRHPATSLSVNKISTLTKGWNRFWRLRITTI